MAVKILTHKFVILISFLILTLYILATTPEIFSMEAYQDSISKYVRYFNADPHNLTNELKSSIYSNVTNKPSLNIPGYIGYRGGINNDICNNSTIYIIYVMSFMENFEKRAAIRNTWGHKGLFKDRRVSVVFVVGYNGDQENVQQKIEQEAGEFKDIIQGSVSDTLKDSAAKGLFALKFLKEFCNAEAKFAIRTNDDMFLNIFKILELVNQSYHRILLEKNKDGGIFSRLMLCPVYSENQHKIPYEVTDFRDRIYYPQYCASDLWVFSLDLVNDMLSKVSGTNSYFTEDVYITGLLLPQVKDVHFVNITANVSLGVKTEGLVIPGIHEFKNQYTNKKPIDWTYLATEFTSVGRLHELWNIVVDSLDNSYMKYLNAGQLTESRMSKY